MTQFVEDRFMLHIFSEIFWSLSPEFLTEVKESIKALDLLKCKNDSNANRLFVRFLFEYARSTNPRECAPWASHPVFDSHSQPPEKEETEG